MGLAVLALGIQSVWLTIYVGRLQPIPDWVPGHTPIAWLTGLFLIVGSLCILTGIAARLAATSLAVVLLLWTLVLQVPQFIAKPGGGGYLGIFETFALFGGAWLLAAMTPGTGRRRSWDPLVDSGRTAGRICFGVSLPFFGLSHFMYHDFVASWVPKWLPAPQFWAYFTGAAHLAAGVAILSNVLTRVAAILAAIMYGSWVILVHVPRVIAAPRDAFEWNGIFVASALCASALLVAGSTVTITDRIRFAAWPARAALPRLK